jgi:hypothetical protein
MLTDELQRECIEAASSAYPIHAATYGEVCKNNETETDLIVWLHDQAGPCIEKKKTEEDTDDLAEDNSPCFSGMFSSLTYRRLDCFVLMSEYSFQLL